MSISDQQLRNELIRFGETVPPVTNRNRQQLIAKLEELKLKNRPRPARSRPGPSLIELSDSDGEIPWPSRAKEPSSVTAEVEQSLARHRREIQQLIESTRERALAMNASISSGGASPRERVTTPKKPVENVKTTRKTENQDSSLRKFWKNNKNSIVETLKALTVGAIFGALLIFLKTKGPNLIPQRKGIVCSSENAVDCDEIVPLIDSIRKQLQIRAGEVDCGFRRNNELFMTRNEILKFLEQKGFRFEIDENERWKLLVNYIMEKPIENIFLWKQNNEPAQTSEETFKMSSDEAKRALICRIQKSLSAAIKTTIWLGFGTAGFLLLFWMVKRRWTQRENQEKLYKDLVENILDLVKNQYEENLENNQTEPWIAVSHIRDTLIQPADREKMKKIWERAVKQINQSESRVRAETQVIQGEEFDVWRWIQPRSTSSPSPIRKKQKEPGESPNEQSYVYSPNDGLTPCLKLRNFFSSDNIVDNDEIDLVIDSIQNRCATVRHLEHIGINDSFVYLKFSSKEGAARGFHLLNNWKFHGREIVAKYLRLERYHEHFPEARETGAR